VANLLCVPRGFVLKFAFADGNFNADFIGGNRRRFRRGRALRLESFICQNSPFATFFINVTGSFLIGFLLILFADKLTAGENLRFAVIVGFLGAYTTFSTFEMEIFSLVREREFVTAFLYLFSSVLLGFIGVCGGVWLAKKI
jgi:fluoride exporter